MDLLGVYTHQEIAPWVDPSKSHMTAFQIAQYIPTMAFGVWHHIPRFFITQAGPALASSGAAFTAVSRVMSPSLVAGDGREGQERSETDRNRARIQSDYGLSRDFQVTLDDLCLKAMFSENTVGANSEALQCLKKGPDQLWGVCDDYQAFVRQLVELERTRRTSTVIDGSEPKRLRVVAYFAETDALVGAKGQQYMENCWIGGKGLSFEDVLDFATNTVGGTNHDTVVQSVQVLEGVFAESGAVITR